MADKTNVFAAFGAVLGYIGAEAATVGSFERLLWPQRFYSNWSLGSTLKNGLLMPMGGPLHKAALKTLDVCLTHGLFKGPQQGHMLGTVFFRQLNWSYTMHGDGVRYQSHTEPLRNCLWARVLSYTPIPPFPAATSSSPTTHKDSEAPPSPRHGSKPLRSRTLVSHLTLSAPSPKDISNPNLPFVCEGVGVPTFGVLFAICASEFSAIVVAIAVILSYRSAWGVFWLAPLFLRLVSAVLAVDREPLLSLSSSASDDPHCDFELNCPQSDGNFMLITGPPTLVLQFFRHYGHPVRNRFREVLQLAIIAAFASLFPLGLLCSVIWMNEPVQYVWLCYQLYVILTMHVVRYSEVGQATTTEAKIAEIFHRGSVAGPLGGGAETAILFGQKRDVGAAVKAAVVNTYHSGYKEGKECIERMLRRHNLKAGEEQPREMLRGTSRTLSTL